MRLPRLFIKDGKWICKTCGAVAEQAIDLGCWYDLEHTCPEPLNVVRVVD